MLLVSLSFQKQLSLASREAWLGRITCRMCIELINNSICTCQRKRNEAELDINLDVRIVMDSVLIIEGFTKKMNPATAASRLKKFGSVPDQFQPIHKPKPNSGE